MPIYRQIIDQIRHQIAAGVLQEGDKLPSVRALATKLAVNQNTVLKVYTELCRENTLKIVRGDGSLRRIATEHERDAHQKREHDSVLHMRLVGERHGSAGPVS